MWEAHRIERKHEEPLSLAEGGTQSLGGRHWWAVPGEARSLFLPSLVPLCSKIRLLGEEQTRLVPQCVLGTVPPRPGVRERLGSVHADAMEVLLATEVRMEAGPATSGDPRTPESEHPERSLGNCYSFLNDVESSLETVELEDLFQVAPHG